MKKILTLLIFSLLSTHAQVIDAVAIDVEGEAITTLEIQAAQQKLNMTKKAAVERLILDRLEKAAIKKADITIDRDSIQQKVNSIAASKGMNQEQMKSILSEKGLTWSTYIEQLTMEMKKERFFREHIMATIDRPSDSELETYYNTHKSDFASAPRQMSLVAYKSQSAENLKKSIENPMQPVADVEKQNILAASNEMSPALLNLINKTEDGAFTTPVNTGKGFIAYFVKSKGTGQSGFASVKNTVIAHWMQDKKVQASQDFLNKLKSNAKIRVIRL